jgi:uncharacterized protein YfcZ (UPF0381/DUF406 family)
MPDDKATPVAVSLDDEGRALQLEAEKAKYRQSIATATAATGGAGGDPLASLVPTIADAPKGEVTLGQNAGAFGPWRAHVVLNLIATRLADDVRSTLAECKPQADADPEAADPEDGGVPDGGKAPQVGLRVLVVDDRDLLRKDWTAHQVESTIQRLTDRLVPVEVATAEAVDTLDAAVAAYQAADVADRAAAAVRNRRRGATVAPGGETETDGVPEGTGASGSKGALGAAIDLLGLLRTDYSLTAATVVSSPSELAVLTASRLARQADKAKALVVEADVFSTIRESAQTAKFETLLTNRDTAVHNLSRLQVRLAPVEAELAAITARIAAQEQIWASAVADGKDATATASLRAGIDLLVAQQSRREKAAGPARAVIAYARQVLADVDAGTSALTQAPQGGEAPLLTAVRHERLAATVAEDRITHVLYLNLDSVAADAVTRRSILGISGRIRFLSAGNASWLLLDAATGTIAGGGQVSQADVMTFGLETGTAKFNTGDSGVISADDGGDDRLVRIENAAKGIVAALVMVLLAAGVVSVLAAAKLLLS